MSSFLHYHPEVLPAPSLADYNTQNEFGDTDSIYEQIPRSETAYSIAVNRRIFPLDIEERFIDQLEDDVEALRRCALACRVWHPRSRYHLFRSIRIRTRAEYLEICSFLEAHRHLALLVGTLTITPTHEEPRPLTLLGVALVPLLARLPRLQSYRLRQKGASDCKIANIDALKSSVLSYHPNTLTSLRQYAHGVQYLRLESVVFRDSHELARFVISLPSLRNLHCVGVAQAGERPLNSGSRFIGKSQLVSLTLQHIDLNVTESLVQLSLSSLESMTLNYNFGDISGAIWEVRNNAVLQPLTALKDLRVSFTYEPGGATLEEFLRLTRRALPRLHHPSTLHNLSIVLPYLHCTFLSRALGKEARDQCLDLDDFLARYEKIRVVFDLPSVKRNNGGSWASLLGLRFPKVQARAGLHVVSSADNRVWGHDSAVKVLQVYPDSGVLLSCSADGNVLTWDIHHEGVLRNSFRLDASRVGALSISLFPLPQIGRFACTEGSQNISIWDADTGVRVRTLKAGPQGVNAFTCSTNGRIIVTASVRQRHRRVYPVGIDGYQIDVHLWQNSARRHAEYEVVDTISLRTKGYASGTNGQIQGTKEPYNVSASRSYSVQDDLDIPEQIKAVALSPSRLVLACIEKHGSRTLSSVWRRDSKYASTTQPRWFRVIYTLYDRDTTSVTAWAFCPTSYIPSNTPGVTWSASAPKFSHECDRFAAGFSDGRVVVSYIPLGLGWTGLATEHDRTVTKTVSAHSITVTSVAFSPDGKLLVSASADGTIKALHHEDAIVHDREFDHIPPMKGHTGAVHAVCVSPSGKYIASASEDRTVRLWSTRNWSCVAVFTEHRAAVTHVVFTPEGDAVWSGARDGAVRRHPFLYMIRGGA